MRRVICSSSSVAPRASNRDLGCGSLLFLTVAYNDYVYPLYHTTPGHLVLGLAAVLLLCGALAIRKIVTFKV